MLLDAGRRDAVPFKTVVRLMCIDEFNAVHKFCRANYGL